MTGFICSEIKTAVSWGLWRMWTFDCLQVVQKLDFFIFTLFIVDKWSIKYDWNNFTIFFECSWLHLQEHFLKVWNASAQPSFDLNHPGKLNCPLTYISFCDRYRAGLILPPRWKLESWFAPSKMFSSLRPCYKFD